MTDIMRALTNSYVVHFNKNIKGAVRFFSGKYKAILIEGGVLSTASYPLYSP